MTITTTSPRMPANSEAAVVAAESQGNWTALQLEPCMFGMSGGLTASGGDFGFELPDEVVISPDAFRLAS